MVIKKKRCIGCFFFQSDFESLPEDECSEGEFTQYGFRYIMDLFIFLRPHNMILSRNMKMSMFVRKMQESVEWGMCATDLLVIITADQFFIAGEINPSRPDPGRREKINLNFYFTLLYGASEGFMKALKAFLFYYNFLKCMGRKGLSSSKFLILQQTMNTQLLNVFRQND